MRVVHGRDGDETVWITDKNQERRRLVRHDSLGRPRRRLPLGVRGGWILLLLLLLTAVACSGVVIEREPAGVVPTGAHEVSLTIVQGPGGSTLAFVPVYINDQGPFGFALDTGASQSVVDLDIVERLNISILGDAGPATGVGGMVPARLIRVEHWRVGDVDLPSKIITTIDLPEHSGQVGFEGLLGSDILSNFKVITIDFERGVLILGPQSPSPIPAPATRSGLPNVALRS